MTGDSHIPRKASLVTVVDMKPISGHDGMANLCKPITAYDLQVRYNNLKCPIGNMKGVKARGGVTSGLGCRGAPRSSLEI